MMSEALISSPGGVIAVLCAVAVTTLWAIGILVAAVGRAEMVRGDWLKPGAVVIDFGTSLPGSTRALGEEVAAAVVLKEGAEADAG